MEDYPTQMIPLAEVKPNDWNPNVMAAADFNDLVDNIEDLGFVQPVVVVEIDDDPPYKYLVIDGEHRFEALRITDHEEVNAIVIPKLKGDKYKQMVQTVKLNKIKGTFSREKFMGMVEEMLTDHSFDEVAEDLLFHDPTELEEMIESARAQLPNDEMKDEFDKAREDIKTVDDLALLLNRLFTEYGTTLPYNFMILDFGGKEHIWIRMQRNVYKDVREKARQCMGHGITFDSLVGKLFTMLDINKFVGKYKDFLEEVPEEEASKGKVTALDELTDLEE